MKRILISVVLVLLNTSLSPLKISSSAFAHQKQIPQKYTCQGENLSPTLSWKNVPKETKSFVLICDDPDAPVGTWVHWVLYDIPATFSQLTENAPLDKKNIGVNSWGKAAYGGPCPPSGTHRYFFKLYALSVQTLGLPAGATKAHVEVAMKKYILAQAQIIGTYQKK